MMHGPARSTTTVNDTPRYGVYYQSGTSCGSKKQEVLLVTPLLSGAICRVCGVSKVRDHHRARRNGFGVRSHIGTCIDGGCHRISPTALGVAEDEEERVVPVGERCLHLV